MADTYCHPLLLGHENACVIATNAEGARNNLKSRNLKSGTPPQLLSSLFIFVDIPNSIT
jgi:hypothetical protein